MTFSARTLRQNRVLDAGAAPRAVDVGGVLLAALREDGRFRSWTSDVAEPELLEAVLSAANCHQVLAIVRRALRVHDSLVESTPDWVNAALTETVAQYLRVNAELVWLAEILEPLEQPWAVLKGPVLAELAYPEPPLRPYADLDLLVPVRSFGDALSAIEHGGATLVDRNWSYQLRMRRAQSTLVLPRGTHLDLHWHLLNEAQVREAFSWDVEQSLARRRAVPLGRLEVPTLDEVDTVLHVALHGAISGGHRLLWCVDLAGLIRSGGFDWDDLVRRARGRGIALPVGLMLRRSRRLIGAPIPEEVLCGLDMPKAGALTLSAIERLARPASVARGRHTGRTFVAAARSDARSTARALVATLTGSRASSGPLGANPLHRPDDDPTGRVRYLQMLAEV